MDANGDKMNNHDGTISFGGWESDKDKLRHNLTWTPEQILIWLEEANAFARDIKEQKYVLRKYNK